LFSSAIVAFGGRILSLQGLVAPVRIGGDSMAPTLLGAHHHLACRDCGFPFDCGTQHPPPDQLAICPNCGENNQLEPAHLRSGQRVIIDHLAFSLKPPQRYELVAIRDPLNEAALATKRVVGLPGEQVTIVEGELLIDGRLSRKSSTQWRKLAIPVHDDRYRPRRTGAKLPRWSSGSPSSTWRAMPDGFQIDKPRSMPPETNDWLSYVNQSFYRGPRSGREGSIVDNDAFNQGSSRQLAEVRDVAIRCRLRCSADACLVFLVRDGRDDFRVVLEAGRRLRLLRGNVLLAESSFSLSMQDRPIRVEYAICDRQLFLTLDGREVVQSTYHDRDVPFQPPTHPFAIGVRWGSIAITELLVQRDIYWQPPFDHLAKWVAPRLGPDEFLLLGDNVPISIDSRHWPAAGIRRDTIVGRILEF
jgi:hypothetical protein